MKRWERRERRAAIVANIAAKLLQGPDFATATKMALSLLQTAETYVAVEDKPPGDDKPDEPRAP